MTGHGITLELPHDVYQRAQRVAKATQRSLEEVVLEWIRPPAEGGVSETDIPEAMNRLEDLTDAQLLQVAQAQIPPEHARRLQELLTAQRRRSLTQCEQREATELVEQEDLLTLRKARALFLLQQRGRLSGDLTALRP